MAGYGRKKKQRKLWLRLAALVLLTFFFLFDRSGCKETLAKTVMETTPIGTTVKVVMPDSIGDKRDDSMTVRITNYEFESAAKDYYYLKVDFMFNSLGYNGQNVWESKAVFYDKKGNVLNRKGTVDGYLWSSEKSEAAAMGKTYSYRVYVHASIAGNVAAIVFQEHYHEPDTLPADPSMGQPSYWDTVYVYMPQNSELASLNDSNMRVRIKDYHFENADTGLGYYLYLNMTFLSLGKNGKVWTGRALFFDEYGNMIQGGIGDNYGYFELNTTLALGRSYTVAIEIPETIKERVAAIGFQTPAGNDTDPSGSNGGKISQSLTAKNLKKVLTGKSFKLSVGGNHHTTLSFKSGNTKIATVSKTGVVKMKKLGSVKITITAPGNAQYKQAKKTITLKIVPATPKLSISVKNGVMTITWSKVKGAAWYCCNVDWGNGSSKMTKKWTQRRGPAEKGKTYTITVTAQEKENNPKFKSKAVKKKVKVK